MLSEVNRCELKNKNDQNMDVKVFLFGESIREKKNKVFIHTHKKKKRS